MNLTFRHSFSSIRELTSLSTACMSCRFMVWRENPVAPAVRRLHSSYRHRRRQKALPGTFPLAWKSLHSYSPCPISYVLCTHTKRMALTPIILRDGTLPGLMTRKAKSLTIFPSLHYYSRWTTANLLIDSIADIRLWVIPQTAPISA